MSILKLTAPSEEDVPRSTTAPNMAGLLPITVILPAVTTVFHDRLGAAASVALVVASLVLVAAAGALVARSAARVDVAAVRARRAADVLDAPEPLAGARR
ncbi:hypothetical protein ACGFYY_28880 [Streptomyces sp. NPDC048331]|uniref:hypothetical protein n=1 Tax=Streptomyces sp. NPDC048331 TaxID=3365534 RepID=UPI00371CC681